MTSSDGMPPATDVRISIVTPTANLNIGSPAATLPAAATLPSDKTLPVRRASGSIAPVIGKFEADRKPGKVNLRAPQPDVHGIKRPKVRTGMKKPRVTPRGEPVLVGGGYTGALFPPQGEIPQLRIEKDKEAVIAQMHQPDAVPAGERPAQTRPLSHRLSDQAKMWHINGELGVSKGVVQQRNAEINAEKKEIAKSAAQQKLVTSMMGFLAERTDRLATAFRQVDEDKSGVISEQELDKLLLHVAPSSSVAERAGVFKIIDCNGDGGVDFKEFIDALVDNTADATSLPDNRELAAQTAATMSKIAPVPHLATSAAASAAAPILPDTDPKDNTHWKDTYSDWQQNASYKSNNLGVRPNGGHSSCDTLWPSQILAGMSPVLPSKPTWGPQGPKVSCTAGGLCMSCCCQVVPNRKQRLNMGKTTGRFGSQDKVVRDMMEFLAARTDKLSAAFRLIDEDKSGTIDQYELGIVLKQVAPESTQEQRDTICALSGCNAEGGLQFHEFCDKLATKDCDTGKFKVHKHPKPSWAQTVPLRAARTGSKKQLKSLEVGRSSGVRSAMDARTYAEVTPRLQHGRGVHSKVFDDGLLRTMVAGPVEKVWYDTRDWGKMSGFSGEPNGRLSASVHNAHAASGCVHSNHYSTLGLTQPMAGSPWFAEGTSDWMRGAKNSNQIQNPGVQTHPDPIMRRVQHIKRRSREVEDEFRRQHDRRLQMYDNRIAKIGKGKLAVQAVTDAHNEGGFTIGAHSGKRYIGPPIGFDANGYQTHQCLNPGLHQASHGCGDAYPKRQSPLQFWKSGKVRLTKDLL